MYFGFVVVKEQHVYENFGCNFHTQDINFNLCSSESPKYFQRL